MNPTKNGAQLTMSTPEWHDICEWICPTGDLSMDALQTIHLYTGCACSSRSVLCIIGVVALYFASVYRNKGIHEIIILGELFYLNISVTCSTITLMSTSPNKWQETGNKKEAFIGIQCGYTYMLYTCYMPVKSLAMKWVIGPSGSWGLNSRTAQGRLRGAV